MGSVILEMPCKVLFISSWYPNQKDRTHGIFVKRYAEAVALFNDVAVIQVVGDESFSDTIRVESKIENKVHEIFVYYKKKNINPFKKFRNYRSYYKTGLNCLLKEWGRPDLLQVNVVFPVAIAAMPIIKELKIPYVVSEHWTGYHPEDGSYTGFVKKYFTKQLIKNAGAIITVTSHLKRSMMLQNLGGDYHVIPNVVNEEIFRFKDVSGQSKFRFLHVSSLDKRQKNVEAIIDAFREFLRSDNSCELIIAGDGENRINLEKSAAEMLNSSVFFIGNKFGKELADVYNSCHCFVLFSNFENLPVVLLEAQCCGLPIITTDVGGINEFLHEDDVEFVNAGDQTALLCAMKKMRKDFGKFDRRKISETAAGKFGYRTIGKRFDDIYNRILKK